MNWGVPSKQKLLHGFVDFDLLYIRGWIVHVAGKWEIQEKVHVIETSDGRLYFRQSHPGAHKVRKVSSGCNREAGIVCYVETHPRTLGWEDRGSHFYEAY